MYIDDEQQQEVIELRYSTALVLAGPGCGKTHILAKRVYHAIAINDHKLERMLCITFTNRAAREMSSRVEEYLGSKPAKLFVGNIHRFCLRFLFSNQLIDADTTVMDEEDQYEYLSETFDLRTEYAIRDFLSKKEHVYAVDNDFPAYVIRRTTSEISAEDYDRIAAYRSYQADNHIIDFDDILQIAFRYLLEENASDYQMTGYDWVQVDEVQDMTPLQIGIIERVTSNMRTVVWFGDEQQAIFRFIGAGGPALDWLKKICTNRIYRLRRNYRSPDYLVDMCNVLAARWLKIPRILLPDATNRGDRKGNMICYNGTHSELLYLTAARAMKWSVEYPASDTAVLVRTNKAGNELAGVFDKLGIKFFHISQKDLFHQVAFKTVWSHLAAVKQPLHTQAWARLLYQTGAVHTMRGARSLVALLRHNGINPVELLNIDKPGAVERLYDAFHQRGKTIVVFDTETTGLDIFTDEVVQIAAVKIRDGKIVADSQFEVFISTTRELPPLLGDGTANPLPERYAAAEKLSPEEAFKAFRSYIGKDAILAGHNIDFDKGVIHNNIRRRTLQEPDEIFAYTTPALDTLELSRLMLPKQRSYRLGDLIEVLNISGINSHLATDDSLATAEVLLHLAPLAESLLVAGDRCRRHPKVLRAAQRFDRFYGDFYRRWRKAYYSNGSSLSKAISETSAWFVQNGFTSEIERMDYLCKLIDGDIVNAGDEQGFRAQLDAHIYDLLAYNESDLFSKGIVEEKISIMTIHKAKGLEMQNVIIFDATDTFGNADDSARLLYVALSRARRRLALGMSKQPSGALATVIDLFDNINPEIN